MSITFYGKPHRLPLIYSYKKSTKVKKLLNINNDNVLEDTKIIFQEKHKQKLYVLEEYAIFLHYSKNPSKNKLEYAV